MSKKLDTLRVFYFIGLEKEKVMNGLEQLVVQYGGLAGMGALIAVVINLLKYSGAIKDGDSLKWASVFNMAGFVAYWALGMFDPELFASSVGVYDDMAMNVAEVISIVLAIVIQFGSSPAVANSVRGIPLIGKSLSEG